MEYFKWWLKGFKLYAELLYSGMSFFLESFNDTSRAVNTEMDNEH